MFNTSKKNARLYFDIIQQLYYNQKLSCVELSTLINKSIPLVTKSINYLIEQGYVEESGYAPSSGGRRPLVYSLVKNKLYILTVAVDQLNTRIAIVNLENEYVHPIAVSSLKLKDNPTSLATLANLIQEYIDNSGIDKQKIIGIGIGMPGFVNTVTGVNYTYLSEKEQNIPKYISKKTGLPVFIDNDSSVIALSELKFGLAKPIKDILVINFSWGIGLGLIINGQIYRGNNGFAGEFSHLSVSEEGPLCTCGKQGCLEAEASLLAIADNAISGLQQGKKSSLVYNPEISKMTFSEEIMSAALKGDKFAIELLSEAAFKVGKGISILIHILNPKAIVISGKAVKVGKLLIPSIQQAMNQNCISRLSADTDILISELGFDSELIGAAILVMESYNAASKK
ncbi:ROK family protein [Pseudopedobacter beijingensis]|uniref:ROK family protein n=1 Tax=Pseudopedobacter beijingensis TaxID=1207056 RepID=A0ABW4IID7_9SPHI